MDIASLTSLIAPTAAILTAVSPAVVWAGRKMVAMSRTIAALQGAVELHDAQNRGVVLVVTAPALPAGFRSSLPLLRQAGWTVAPYTVAAGEGVLPDTAQFRADCAAADVVILEGQSSVDNTAIAGTRWFRDTLGAGHAVVSYTPSHLVRYDQGVWGDGDQSVTTPATAEAAVRSAVARRRHIQALQGVRPGGLAEARKALVG